MHDSNVSADQLSSPLRGREFVVSGQELWQWWTTARQQAIAIAIPPAELDWFLQALTDVDRLALRLQSFKERETVTLQIPFTKLRSRWQQRLQERVPVQYLTGVAPWRQFVLKVSPAVLIPRPETECLIDLLPPATSLPSGSHWADLGTGSGVIALGLATTLPTATIHAVDYSAEALAIAQVNAATYHLTERIQFYQGSWLEPLASLRGQLSGIVSNPPYIPNEMVLQLQPEVTRHEPHLALAGGEDGLNCIRQLVQTAPDYLQPGGILLFEMMAGQAIAVAELLQQQGSYDAIQIHPDLAGIDRFAFAVRK